MSRPRRTLALCFLAAVCEGFDVQAAGVAAAGLGAELQPTPGELGLFFSASGAGLLLGALLGGRLADRVSRKTILVGSLLAFGACSLLTSVAATMVTLTAGRFLTGLGLGAAMPNLIVLAADSTRADRRSTTIAAVYVGMPFGAGIAGVISLVLASDAWRTVFRVGGIAPLALGLLVALAMPTTSTAPRTAPLSSIGQTLFGERRGLRTARLWLAFFLVVLTLHLLINWLPALLRGRGMSKAEATWAQIGFNVGGAATAMWFGRLLDSRWRRASLVTTIAALPLILFALAAGPHAAGLAFVLATGLGGCVLAQQVVAFALANAAYPAADRGLGVGAAVAAGRIGSLVGPLVVSALLTAGRTPAQVLFGLLPIGIACGASVGVAAWRG